MTNEEKYLANVKWFKEAKFGMMVHFGLYSVLGGEYKGVRMPTIGEWAQSYFRIPNKEYEKLADCFNPIYFNADEWVQTAKDAGMEYFVVTSKHHDGFALFDSEWDNYNSVKGSPFKRDIIAELAEACYKKNMKFGLYYSQELDWHEEHGGGVKGGYQYYGKMAWTNDWDFPDNSKKNFDICLQGKIKTQIKELLTNYGEIATFWCDTPFDLTEDQSMQIYNLIREYQPACLVNSRIGNGVGDYRSCGDNGINFEKGKSEEKPEELTARSKEYSVGKRTGLYECPATLNKTWGYKPFDNEWKSAETLREIKERLNSQGINYLLNVGPDYLGRIPAPSVDILKEMKE